MTIDLVKAGYRVVEVDTKMYHADTGRDLRGFLTEGGSSEIFSQCLLSG